MKPLLEVRGLCKEFTTAWRPLKRRPVRVLDRVDLQLLPGDTYGLIGESGCGKSTLARCILRLAEPTAGSIRFDGIDWTRLEPRPLMRRRREIQIVFQDPGSALNPRMTIRQILSEPLATHNLGSEQQREEKIREALSWVGLDPGILGRRPSALSGGQQQRVVIARALSLRPRLLIADEPVSALDASVQAQILELLAGLQQKFGLTLLLISHSLPVVHYLCARVGVMYLGRIVEEAPADRFFAGPEHPYSRALLASIPAACEPAGRPHIPGEPPSFRNPPSGCAFHPRCAEVMDECREKVPRLRTHTAGNKIACFLYTPGSEPS